MSALAKGLATQARVRTCTMWCLTWLVLLALALAPHASTVAAAPGPPTAWTPVAPMSAPRAGLGTADVGGRIYAIGGVDFCAPPEPATCDLGTKELNRVEAYDPAKGTWTERAPLHTARGGAAAVALDGKVYAIGGANDANGFLNSVEAYDPGADTWEMRAPMPTTPRAFLAAVAAGGKIYAIGGAKSHDEAVNTVEVYSPATDSWEVKAPMPTARAFLAAAAAGGRIYAIGGQAGSGTPFLGLPLATVQEYDPTVNNWRSVADMTVPRLMLAAAAHGNTIYAIGGGRPTAQPPFVQILSTIEAYNTARNTWESRMPMPTERADLAAATQGDQVYAVGGFNLQTGFLRTAEAYRPARG